MSAETITEPLFDDPTPDLSATDDAVTALTDRGFDPMRVRLTGLRPAEWKTEAACAGGATRGDDPWHPGPDGEDGAWTIHARATCGACPVRVQCLALGLALLPAGDVHGMHAGLTPAELREVARGRGLADRRTAQHGTRAAYVEGCHCPDCTRAHNAYYVEQRREESYGRTVPLPVAPQPVEVPEVDDLFTLLGEVS